MLHDFDFVWHRPQERGTPTLHVERDYHRVYWASTACSMDGYQQYLLGGNDGDGSMEFIFEGPCVVMNRAPSWAFEHGCWEDFDNILVFRPTREGWRAAWRIARLLSHANPYRVAIIAREDWQQITAHSLDIGLAGSYSIVPLALQQRRAA